MEQLPDAMTERDEFGRRAQIVGAAVDIQQAKDYTPSHALLYVRYSAAGWQGDLDMPPQPLVPYADW